MIGHVKAKTPRRDAKFFAEFVKGEKFIYHRVNLKETATLKLELNGDLPGFLVLSQDSKAKIKLKISEVDVICFGIGDEIQTQPANGLTIVSSRAILKLENEDSELVKKWVCGLRKSLGYTDQQAYELEPSDTAMFEIGEEALLRREVERIPNLPLVFTQHQQRALKNQEVMVKLTYHDQHRAKEIQLGSEKIDFSRIEAVFHGAPLPAIAKGKTDPKNWFTIVALIKGSRQSFFLHHELYDVVVKWVIGMRGLLRFEDDGDGDALAESDFESDDEKLQVLQNKAISDVKSNGMTSMFNQWEEAYDKREENEAAAPANMFNEWEAAFDKYQDRKNHEFEEMPGHQFTPGSPVRFETAGSMLDFQRGLRATSDSNNTIEKKQLHNEKRQADRNSRYLVTDSTVNLLKTEFIDRRMERYEEEFKRLYKQIRTEPKEYQIGDIVEVRQCAIWREGKVTSVDPLKIQPKNWSKAFRWLEVRRKIENEDNWKAHHETVRKLSEVEAPSPHELPKVSAKDVSKQDPAVDLSDDETSLSLDPSSLPLTISNAHKRDPYQPTQSVIGLVREMSQRSSGSENESSEV